MLPTVLPEVWYINLHSSIISTSSWHSLWWPLGITFIFCLVCFLVIYIGKDIVHKMLLRVEG